MNSGNILSQMGIEQGIDRFTEYNAPVHDHVLHYAYEVPHSTPTPIIFSKHTHHGDHKQNAALSALTLLAFLFFLNILQQCLKDHMTSMNPPQVMIMSAGRADEENLHKLSETKKLDKSGAGENDTVDSQTKANTENEQNFVTRNSDKILEEKAPNVSVEEEKFFMKINITEHIPNRIRQTKIIRNNNVSPSSANVFLKTIDSVDQKFKSKNRLS